MMSTPSTSPNGKNAASRDAASPVPHPASSMLGAAGRAYRFSSADSCGQMARACASRLRTIDSSAICSMGIE